MSQPNNNKPSARLSVETKMEMVVSQAIQIANAQLIAIRETHGYLKHKAAEYGIVLTEQDLHAWSMSAWMELAKSKAHWKMPPTRFEKREPKPDSSRDQSPKAELFPSSEQPLTDAARFSNPNVAPALRRLRQMLRRDSIDERELLAILRESTPQDAVAPATLDEAPARSLELLLSRWSVVRELVEAGRQDGGEAA